MTSLLIVDDDETFCGVLSARLAKRGHEIKLAHNIQQAAIVAKDFEPEWVLVDLKMPGASGLELIPKLLAIDPKTRIVVLTGYASIATAVEAIKLGAIHYLTKPVSTDAIIAAFHKNEGDPKTPVEAETLSLDAAERDHILAVLERNHQNISATARELGLHRRTLQRKLDKMPMRER
jgi:two-component system response regulator RegA